MNPVGLVVATVKNNGLELRRGDRITLRNPEVNGAEFEVLTAMGTTVVYTCPAWPVGANHRANFWDLATVNGVAIDFPKPLGKARRR